MIEVIVALSLAVGGRPATTPPSDRPPPAAGIKAEQSDAIDEFVYTAKHDIIDCGLAASVATSTRSAEFASNLVRCVRDATDELTSTMRAAKDQARRGNNDKLEDAIKALYVHSISVLNSLKPTDTPGVTDAKRAEADRDAQALLARIQAER